MNQNEASSQPETLDAKKSGFRIQNLLVNPHVRYVTTTEGGSHSCACLHPDCASDVVLRTGPRSQRT
jgi:hypothetical protein